MGILNLRGNMLALEVLPAEERTSSGLIIPDIAQETPSRGKVLSAGEMCAVKVGDHVLFNPYAGEQHVHEGKEILILKEGYIYAVYDSKGLDSISGSSWSVHTVGNYSYNLHSTTF